MSRPNPRICTALVFTTVAFATMASKPAHALRKEVTVPDCNTATPECREWRAAVEMLNRMAVGGGEGSAKPQRPVDRTKAMQACIRYMQRVQKQTVPQAQKTCTQELD